MKPTNYTPSVIKPGTPSARLGFVSATSIQTHEACPRKWYYTYVLKIRSPGTKSQQLGTAIHKTLESYFLNPSHPLDSYTLYLRGFVDSLRETGWRSEFKGLVPKLLADTDTQVQIDLSKSDTELLQIRDYKTYSNAAYLKKPSELLDDTQLAIYAHALLKPEHKQISIAHVTIPTRERAHNVQMVGTLITRDQLLRKIKTVEETVEEIKATAYTTSVESVPGKLEHCAAYGGCHVRDQCSFPKTQPVNRALTNAEEKELQRIFEAKQDKGKEEKDKMGDYLKSLGLKTKKVEAKYDMAAAVARIKTLGVGQPTIAAEWGLPDEDCEGEGQLAEYLIEAQEDMEEMLKQLFPAEADAPPPEPTEATPAAKKPRKPRKTAEVESPGCDVIEVTPTAANPTPTQLELPLEEPSIFPPATRNVLYVGCTPSEPVVSADQYIDYVVQASEEMYGGDLRTIKSESFEFGKWRASIIQIVKANPPPVNVYRCGLFVDQVRREVIHALVTHFRATGIVVISDGAV